MPFEKMEQVFGLAGLALVVFAVTAWQLGPDWSDLLSACRAPARAERARRRPPTATTRIALFGAAMTPYEVFFFSSGAVEEHWTQQRPGDEPGQRAGRLPARRAAVAGHHGHRPPRVRTRRHRRRPALAGRPSGRPRARQGGTGVRHLGHLRGDVRRRARDGAVVRLHRCPVLRMAVGQVRAPASSGPLPPRGAGHPARRRAVGTERGRSGEGDRVLDRAVRRGTPAHLLPDPGHRQRSELHGDEHQRPVR